MTTHAPTSTARTARTTRSTRTAPTEGTTASAVRPRAATTAVPSPRGPAVLAGARVHLGAVARTGGRR